VNFVVFTIGISTKNNLFVLQGSVETLFRWGRKRLHYLVAIYSGYYTPNFISIIQVLQNVRQKPFASSLSWTCTYVCI